MRVVPERGWDRIALAAIGLGTVTRFIWVLVFHPPLNYVYSDMLGYVDRARTLASGGHLGRYAAFFPPGTHLLIALPLKLIGDDRAGLWGAAVLWATLSSLTLFFVWRLARLFLTPAAAALTAVFCAAWPLYITYAGYFLSETPSLAFLTGSLWLGYSAMRARVLRAVPLAFMSGILGAVALANRPQFAFNLLVLGVPLLVRWRRYAPAAAGLLAGGVIGVGAFIAYNSFSAGKVTGLAEDGGIVFFQGHCHVREVVTGRLGSFQYTIAPPPAVQRNAGYPYYFPTHPAWEEGFYYKQGLNCIRRDGLGHLATIAGNVFDMTATTIPWPQVDENGARQVVTVVNFLYGMGLLPIVFLSLVLIRRRRAVGEPSGEIVMLWQLACVVALAVIIFGDPRFRAPYDVFGLALLAAVIADHWFDRRDPTGP